MDFTTPLLIPPCKNKQKKKEKTEELETAEPLMEGASKAQRDGAADV